MGNQAHMPVEGLMWRLKEGRLFPQFQCQECHSWIEDAAMALLIGPMEWTATAKVVHKECFGRPRYGPVLYGTEELDTAMAYLLHHIGIDDAGLEEATWKANSLAGRT